MPGCPALVESGHARCPVHSKDLRLSRTKRGYDERWIRLRAAFMREPAHQLCAHCHARGRIELATECDHVIPFRSMDDPRRLDPNNLQPLCATCHRQKTARQKAGGVRQSG
jgi:5-methylcytosine-specific restriction protein A